MSRAVTGFNCLIRTHHITSRKKLQRVRKAATQLGVEWLLVRSGGSPGIMFAQGRDRDSLSEWVAAVQALRYKDFRCARRPEPSEGIGDILETGFDEVTSTAEFAHRMERRGLGSWWRRAMDYQP